MTLSSGTTVIKDYFLKIHYIIFQKFAAFSIVFRNFGRIPTFLESSRKIKAKHLVESRKILKTVRNIQQNFVRIFHEIELIFINF